MAEGPESCGELEAPLLLVRVSGVLDVPAPLPLDLWPEFFLASVVFLLNVFGAGLCCFFSISSDNTTNKLLRLPWSLILIRLSRISVGSNL